MLNLHLGLNLAHRQTKQNKTKTKSRLWVTKQCTAPKANPSRTYHKPTKRFSPEKNKKGCPRNLNLTEILKTSFYSSDPKPKTSFYLETSFYLLRRHRRFLPGCVAVATSASALRKASMEIFLWFFSICSIPDNTASRWSTWTKKNFPPQQKFLIADFLRTSKLGIRLHKFSTPRKFLCKTLQKRAHERSFSRLLKKSKA